MNWEEYAKEQSALHRQAENVLWNKIQELEKTIERQSIEIVRLQDVIFKKNQALKTIDSVQYGLQGIQEDHLPNNSFGYYKEAMIYYWDLSQIFQQIAVKAYRDEY